MCAIKALPLIDLCADLETANSVCLAGAIFYYLMRLLVCNREVSNSITGGWQNQYSIHDELARRGSACCGFNGEIRWRGWVTGR